MMTTLLARSALAALALLTPLKAGAQGAPPEALPLEQLLDITSVLAGDVPQWSPDGSRLLFRSSLGGGALMTVPAEGGFPRRVPVTLGGAGHFLASNMPQYSPDGRLISFVSDRDGNPEIWVWSAETGVVRRLSSLGATGINSYSWAPDGRSIAFAANLYGNYDIWTVDVVDGAITRVTEDSRLEVYPSWTPDGQHILHVRLDDAWVDHEIVETRRGGGGERVIGVDEDFFDYTAGGEFGYPLVSPDGRLVLFRSYRSGWVNYWVVPIEGGEPRPMASQQADQSEATWHPNGGQVAFIANQDGTLSLTLADVEAGTTRALVEPEGMGVVRAPSWSPDGQRISYTLGTPVSSPDLYVVSVRDGRSVRVTHSNLEGDIERFLVAPEKIRYRTAEGIEIPAYLYRPPGLAPGERVPAIIFAHGGPASQYNDSFQAEVQFFVQRGYAALLPNFRGSTGYGKEFQMGARQCWGHCDLADVLGGVEYLKGLNWIDGQRLGITGSSYGGYMSCAAITFAPGVFAAAIPRSGYCNRVGFRTDGELRHIKQVEYYFGDFEENPDVYRRSSPYFFIDQVQTPTLLIHGAGRFPESPQFEQFFEEMQRQYKTVRYRVFQGEDYYVNGRSNRIEMYGEMLEFFDHYLKGLGLPGGGGG